MSRLGVPQRTLADCVSCTRAESLSASCDTCQGKTAGSRRQSWVCRSAPWLIV
jgi:hypothetical protein